MYILRMYIPDPILRRKYEDRYLGASAPTYNGDAGVDLIVPDCVVFSPWDSICIDHRLHAEMVDGKSGEYVSYFLYPRSSICRTPIRLDNSVGIIDSGYRGSIKASFTAFPIRPFFNTGDDQDRGTFVVEVNSRIVQICGPTLEPVRVELVDCLEELSTSDRNHHGFGSTGR